MILVTTEKKSVAEDIGKIIGATQYRTGYLEGNGYLICWAAGHLVGLADPEDYGYLSLKSIWDKQHPENQVKALMEVPIMPDKYKLIVLPNTRKQFEIMKSLMHRSDVEYIIDCGDAGAEGHILQWFIRVKADCKKHVKRCILTDMSESAIRSAFNDLQPIEKYANIVKGEFCKKKADWALGISASRAASITYRTNITVGRVQSPTLYFVVERFLKNRTFKPQTFYTIEAAFDGFTAKWQKDTDDLLPDSAKDETGRALDKSAIEKLIAEIRSEKGEVVSLETKKKKRDRPQLYDTMQLTKDAIKIYGYTGDEVLNAAEELYNTHKITTYPRTDSQYITQDLEPEMKSRIEDIATIERYTSCANKVLSDGLNLGKKIVDSSKVEDHHAIITTTNLKGYDLSKLTETERNVLHLIISRMIESFSGAYKYEETSIAVKFSNGLVFKNSVKVPIDMGFLNVSKELETEIDSDKKENDSGETVNANKAKIFLSLTAGTKLSADFKIKEGKTTAPPLLTEDDLYTAMQTAGDKLGAEGQILKGRGIGTQATRIAIVKTLFDREYIAFSSKGKVKSIIPTNKGLNVIKILPPELYSPMLTAEWENKIALIQRGEMSEENFLSEFKVFLNEKVEQLKIEKDIDFSNSLGKCPRCGGKIFSKNKTAEKDGKKKRYKVYFCTNKDFSIFSTDMGYCKPMGKQLTEEDMKILLDKGKLSKGKNGNKYLFTFGVQTDGKYKGSPKINCQSIR